MWHPSLHTLRSVSVIMLVSRAWALSTNMRGGSDYWLDAGDLSSLVVRYEDPPRTQVHSARFRHILPKAPSERQLQQAKVRIAQIAEEASSPWVEALRISLNGGGGDAATESLSKSLNAFVLVAMVVVVVALYMCFGAEAGGEPQSGAKSSADLFRLVQYQGTWAQSWLHAEGKKKEALELLFRCRIIPEEEFANGVASQEQVDESTAIAMNMLTRLPLEHWISSWRMAVVTFNESNRGFPHSCTPPKAYRSDRQEERNSPDSSVSSSVWAGSTERSSFTRGNTKGYFGDHMESLEEMGPEVRDEMAMTNSYSLFHGFSGNSSAPDHIEAKSMAFSSMHESGLYPMSAGRSSHGVPGLPLSGLASADSPSEIANVPYDEISTTTRSPRSTARTSTMRSPRGSVVMSEVNFSPRPEETPEPHGRRPPTYKPRIASNTQPLAPPPWLASRSLDGSSESPPWLSRGGFPPGLRSMPPMSSPNNSDAALDVDSPQSQSVPRSMPLVTNIVGARDSGGESDLMKRCREIMAKSDKKKTPPTSMDSGQLPAAVEIDSGQSSAGAKPSNDTTPSQPKQRKDST